MAETKKKEKSTFFNSSVPELQEAERKKAELKRKRSRASFRVNEFFGDREEVDLGGHISITRDILKIKSREASCCFVWRAPFGIGCCYEDTFATFPKHRVIGLREIRRTCCFLLGERILTFEILNEGMAEKEKGTIWGMMGCRCCGDFKDEFTTSVDLSFNTERLRDWIYGPIYGIGREVHRISHLRNDGLVSDSQLDITPIIMKEAFVNTASEDGAVTTPMLPRAMSR